MNPRNAEKSSVNPPDAAEVEEEGGGAKGCPARLDFCVSNREEEGGGGAKGCPVKLNSWTEEEEEGGGARERSVKLNFSL